VKKVNSWFAGSQVVILIFTSLANILATPSDTPPVVSIVSKLCLERYVNLFAREALLAEKPNDDSLVVLHPLIENRERTDFAIIIRNALLM
jgi:hypothetical protein